MNQIKTTRGSYNEIKPEPKTATIKGQIFTTDEQGIYSVKAERKDFPNAYAIQEFAKMIRELGIEKAEFDRKGRGEAINCDLYAYGILPGTKKRCYVVQTRSWEKITINGWARVNKSYSMMYRVNGKVQMFGMKSGMKMRAAINRGADNASLILIALDEVKNV